MCPVPSFDQENFSKYGYENSYQYSQGVFRSTARNKDNVGWTGNSSTEVNIVESSVSILKHYTDCPEETDILFDIDGLRVNERASFELSNALFPYGKCCKIIKPERANKEKKCYFCKPKSHD